MIILIMTIIIIMITLIIFIIITNIEMAVLAFRLL